MRHLAVVLCLAAAGCVADDSYPSYPNIEPPQFTGQGPVELRPAPPDPSALGQPREELPIDGGPRGPTQLIPPSMALAPPPAPFVPAPAPPLPIEARPDDNPPPPTATQPDPEQDAKRARMYQELQGNGPAE